MRELLAKITRIFNTRKPLLRFLSWFILGNTCIFLIIGIRYLMILFSVKSLFDIYVAYTTFLGKAFVLLFTFSSFVGQFSLLAFLPLFFAIFPLIMVFNRRFLTFFCTILIGTLSIILLFADSVVYANYHFHINLAMIKIVFDYGPIAFFELSQREILFIVTISLVILLVEIALALFVWKQIVVKDRWHVSKKIIGSLLGCLYLSYTILIFSMLKINIVFAEQTPNLPLYSNILAAIIPYKNSLEIIEHFCNTRFSQPLFPNAPLHYPLHALQCRAKKTPYNILIIGIDTWRFDAMNQILTPNINQFSKKAWRFSHHLSGGNSTQAGLFSLFYSLPSNYWASMLQQKKGAAFIHELLNHGYQAKVIFSSEMTPPFNKNIFYELKNLRITPEPGQTIPDKDKAVTEEFRDFLKTRDASKPFFTFLLYDAVHGYCEKQNIPKLYPSTNRDCLRLLISDASSQADIVNRYKNAVHFVDSEVKKVLATVKEKGLLKNTIVIITGDHGEEFNDNHLNYWGHSSNYTPYQVNTPLVIYWPGEKPKVWTHETSHYDLVPTLMNRVLGCQNPTSDYSVGKDLLNTQDPPYVLVGSYINMAIVQKTRNITLLTSGNIQVCDNAANNLPNVKIDENLIARALLDMRKYYQYKKL